MHCYLLRGSTDIIFFKCYFVESNITNGRKHVSICSIHSNLNFNYLANVLSSAQFQWETVDQSKLHNSENSNAFFFFLVILHWRVKGKGDLYSRWKHVHACLSAHVRQERSSPTFCNSFSQQISIHPNTQTLKPARGCEHARWRRLWKLHKEQYRTLPSILSCHQYPFGWLLTFLCGRLVSAHHAPSRTSTLFCLDLVVECNLKYTFWVSSPVRFLIQTRTGLSPIPQNNTVWYLLQ